MIREPLAALELVGATLRVLEAPNAFAVGVGGTVVDETMSMIALRGAGKTRWIPKAGSVMGITVGQRGEARVDGDALVGRPHDRRGARR